MAAGPKKIQKVSPPAALGLLFVKSLIQMMYNGTAGVALVAIGHIVAILILGRDLNLNLLDRKRSLDAIISQLTVWQVGLFCHRRGFNLQGLSHRKRLEH